MATKLKNLKITSTDVVDRGANPEANICFFKRETESEKMDWKESFLNWLDKLMDDSSPKKTEEKTQVASEEKPATGDEIEKMADEISQLKKRLELKDLEELAKPFEVLGKNRMDLAEDFYEMKKSGNKIFDTYYQTLENQLSLVEKQGLFSEFGKETGHLSSVNSGGNLGDIGLEIAKRDGIPYAEAVVKAYEEFPDLAFAYEKSYKQ